MKTKKISGKTFVKLCEEDIKLFVEEFGKQKLIEVVMSGNLPLREKTMKKFQKDKSILDNFDFKQFI